MQTLHEQTPTEPVLLPEYQTRQEEQTATREHIRLPQTTGKRMVSKRRYIANIGKKIALSSFSLGFLLVASVTLILTFFLVSIWRMPAGHRTDFGTPEEVPPLIVGSAIISLICYFLAWRTLHKVSKVETGVPLTRANAADVPASDSLVRASAEPMQAQEAVLLRAATQSTEKRAEQLLRATNEQDIS